MASERSGDSSQFRQRYAIEWVAGSGLLVDLTSGNYFCLNKTAAEICRVLFEGGSKIDITGQVADRLRVAPNEAVELLSSMELALQTPAIREEPVGPFLYTPRAGSYDLMEGERSILTVDQDGRQLRLSSSLHDLNYPIVDYLRAIAPKILRLRGIPILHASACILANGALTGFSGKSGAGKTTIAAAFSASGGNLVSEDLIVFSADGNPVAYLEGEKIVHGWSSRMAVALLSNPLSVVNCDGLSSAARGAAMPLDTMWFLDAARRDGTDFVLRRLSEIDGFVALLGQSFLAALDARNVRRHLKHTRRLAEKVALIEATVPEGLENLSLAARHQSANSAS